MKEEDVRSALLSIFQALKTGDSDPFKSFITNETYWEVAGKSPFAGKYVGPDECARIILARRGRSDPPLEPFGEDIAVSPYHGILMFAARGHRHQRTHLSHEIIVAGYGPDSFAGIHHYIYQLHKFDAFWT